MMELNKEYITRTLQEEKLWKVGEMDTFKYNEWELSLRKEEDIYKPFMFSVNGKKDNSNATLSRRYTSMEKAFLHIVNRFNENANIENKYQSILDYINS